MVVHEEDPGTAVVAKPHPLHSTLTEKALLVFSHPLVSAGLKGPAALVEGHAEGAFALEGFVLVLQTSVTEHPPGVLALLETHEVEGLVLRVVGNVLARLAVLALVLDEQVPPVEVVSQHLDAGGGRRCRADHGRGEEALHRKALAGDGGRTGAVVSEVPVGRRHAHLAPLGAADCPAGGMPPNRPPSGGGRRCGGKGLHRHGAPCVPGGGSAVGRRRRRGRSAVGRRRSRVRRPRGGGLAAGLTC
mmetsp:Transcript_33371/g.104028  ORF Transcript_33371/g.104028 Transcript_33371/m.104028 type:complete len:246 (+) Transcript_33371:1489-2226(+)